MSVYICNLCGRPAMCSWNRYGKKMATCKDHWMEVFYHDYNRTNWKYSNGPAIR